MASQLVGNVVPNASGTDYGVTIDVLLGLASTGVGADQVAATAQALYQSGSAYIGAPDTVATNWPQIAKMALALEVAGLDPTTFPAVGGPRNLIGELRSVLNPDGSFGAANSDSVFSHPLALLALARTAGGVDPSAIGWLAEQQCADGSFGWAPDCSAPDADSTALAMQALSAAGAASGDPVLAKAQAWLLTQQDASGGFTSLWAGVNTNTTGLVSQALRATALQAATQATKYVVNLQISPDAVAAHPGLTAGDIGAIATDQTGFTSAMTTGLTPAVAAASLRATAQAVFALGGPDLANLTVLGAQASLPGRSGPTTPPAGPTAGPTGTQPTAQANPTPTSGLSAPTGGSVVEPGWAGPRRQA